MTKKNIAKKQLTLKYNKTITERLIFIFHLRLSSVAYPTQKRKYLKSLSHLYYLLQMEVHLLEPAE